jgi:hypothetical protein
MLSFRVQNIRILFALTLLLTSEEVYSQIPQSDTTDYDTTDYVPSYVRGSLDYNLMIAASKGYTKEVDRPGSHTTHFCCCK